MQYRAHETFANAGADSRQPTADSRRAQIIDPGDIREPLRRGPSSTAIPWVRRFLRIQLHHCSTTRRRIACSGSEAPDQGAVWSLLVRFRDELTGESDKADEVLAEASER